MTDKIPDALAVLDAHAEGIEMAHKNARGKPREEIGIALDEFRKARDAFAAEHEALKRALADSGCDGDLCTHFWHDRAREALAAVENLK